MSTIRNRDPNERDRDKLRFYADQLDKVAVELRTGAALASPDVTAKAKHAYEGLIRVQSHLYDWVWNSDRPALTYEDFILLATCVENAFADLVSGYDSTENPLEWQSCHDAIVAAVSRVVETDPLADLGVEGTSRKIAMTTYELKYLLETVPIELCRMLWDDYAAYESPEPEACKSIARSVLVGRVGRSPPP